MEFIVLSKGDCRHILDFFISETKRIEQSKYLAWDFWDFFDVTTTKGGSDSLTLQCML
jgi:hypothetical protein